MKESERGFVGPQSSGLRIRTETEYGPYTGTSTEYYRWVDLLLLRLNLPVVP